MEKESSPFETLVKIRIKHMLRNGHFGRGKRIYVPPLTKEEREAHNKALEELEDEQGEDKV